MVPDLSPAFARLASLFRQEREILRRRRMELGRLRRIGELELTRALRPLKLLPGQTILTEEINGRQFTPGVYRGARISTPPEKDGDPWYVEVYLRSVLKSGKAGGHTWVRTLRGATVAEAVSRLRVAGTVATGRKGDA